ncbi:MAG: hypothetical protein AB7J35_04400 [Dehalococcoidia bacterium]
MTSTATGFTFTETMGGHLGDVSRTFEDAQRQGKTAGETLRFKVTITIRDLGAFLDDPTHQAPMTGTIDSSALGEDLPVEEGVFNLLERTPEGRLRMGYLLKFRSADGVPYVLQGFKDVHNDRMIDFWYDTTALFTTLRREDDAEGTSARHGILRIRILDLAAQVASMRNPNGGGILGHVKGLVRFNWFFGFTLAREYARPPRRAAVTKPV